MSGFRRLAPCAILLLAVMAAAGTPAFPATPVEDAIRLQREGRNRDAQHALRALLPDLRVSHDFEALASVLAAATDASLALGEYEAAIQDAQEAFDVHQRLGRRADAAWDLNAIGLANLYLARYDKALDHYSRALQLDRTSGDVDGEVTRLNNIGNVHYMRGHYADALRLYEDAMAKAETRTSERSRPRLRKMTISNLAVLHQRLGADERALDLYARIGTGETMQPSEVAQLLINQGWLLRRLGDPVKAMETYARAQTLFARAQHRDGEIGAWRNIGIAYAMDLNDHPKALDAFEAALKLARGSSNRRGEAQALLYRGETLRRMGRLDQAADDLQAALDAAARVGLVEEEWKALYGLGRVLEAQDRREDARRSYERAIAAIESVRADLQAVSLKSEFLADKRDVYDALIALRLAEPSVSTAALFELIEQSRARTWQDRLQPGARRLSLADVQPKIAADVMLLVYWTAGKSSAVLWLSNSSSGIVKQASSRDDIASVQRLAEAVSRDGDGWRTASAAAGRILLSGLPSLTGVTRLLVVPDGPLHDLPFEVLTVPAGGDLLVERVEISYLPSAAFLVHRNAQSDRPWKWPWQRMLVVFGDPPSVSAATSTGATTLPRLSYADDEIRGIAGSLPGTSVLHVGGDAQKRFLFQELRTAPLLHFSTHAIGDTRDPERSRILLAPAGPGEPADYLYLREIYELDLSGVQLVTLAACDTERGKVIRGEGVEGFGRALLAAGAATAITTKWNVADRASAELMKQFYFALARGRSEASALRQAKLQFLRSQLTWSHPRYWAGYILNGDGRERFPRVLPWSALVGVLLFSAIAAATGAHRLATRRGGRYSPEPLAASGPLEAAASVGSHGVTVHAASSQTRPNTWIGTDDIIRTDAPGSGETPSNSSDSSSASR